MIAITHIVVMDKEEEIIRITDKLSHSEPSEVGALLKQLFYLIGKF